MAPTHSNTKVGPAKNVLKCLLRIIFKDPPPWIPAVSQDTSAGASDDAELHMIRAVNTGIINVRVDCFKAEIFLFKSIVRFHWQSRNQEKRY
jgi:hypothetical protein